MYSFFFVFAVLFSINVMAYQGSIVVLNSSNQSVLGSASRICRGLYSEQVHFITAAHVVEGISELSGTVDPRLGSFKLRKVSVSSDLDLALLTSEPGAIDMLLPCHSLPPLMYEDSYPQAFDVLALKDDEFRYQFEIEGYDSELNVIRSEKIEAPIIKTIQKGFPGRDDLDELLMTTFKAKPGFSGGLVVGPVSMGGYVRRFVIGIVIAADSEFNRVAMVPAQTINKWLLSVNWNQKVTETRRVDFNKILNFDLNLTMASAQDVIKPVGLLSFGGVGTGRPAVGSPLVSLDSGIRLNEESNIKWFSIGDKWVEGEPLNDATKQFIQKHRSENSMEGVYKNEKGEWSKTSGSSFPKILRLGEIAYWLNKKPEDCMTVQLKNIKTAKMASVDLCEHISQSEGTYKISSENFKIITTLRATDANRVDVQTSINGSSVQSTSLRRIENSNFKVKLEGLSGIEIQNKKTGDWWVGPVR